MTYEQYKEHINEKINRQPTIEINKSTILGLLAQYNMRFVSCDAKDEFRDVYLKNRHDIIVSAYNSKNELEDFEVAQKLLLLCDSTVQKEFADASDLYLGLYNVHNLVLSKELSPERMSVKKARADGEREMSYAKEDEKVNYIQKAQIVKGFFDILNDDAKLQSMGKHISVSVDKFKNIVEEQFKESVSEFIEPEMAYLSTVVENAILWDEKIINPVNQEISKVI